MGRTRGRALLYPIILLAIVVIYLLGTKSSVRAPFATGSTRISSGRSNDAVFVRLDARDFPESSVVNGVGGFNYFNNLYLHNGTWFFVSNKPEAAGFPTQSQGGVRFILTDVSEGSTKGVPGDDMFRVVSTKEARGILGGVAIRKTGVSLYFNDVDGPVDPKGRRLNSFLGHYYHFGEMFLGLWRLTVSAGDFELPSRLIYRAGPETWRDRARITPWFQSSVLAGCEIQESLNWDDQRNSNLTFVYERIGIADRWAAHNTGTEVKYWNKATADLPSLVVPMNWMDPLRDRVVLLSESSGCPVQRRNPTVPVVTYIDRQKTARRLVDEDHSLLLQSLRELEEQGLIEFHHAQMEFIDRVEQFCLAARTDIMVGVHGNGMSHQLWMPPGSGVVEIMNVGGFTRDYAILAEMMSHEYYAIHNDTHLPREKWTQKAGFMLPQNKGFHSRDIRAHSPYVAGLVKDMAARRRHGPVPVKW